MPSLRHAFLPASLVVLAGAVILRRRVLAVLGIIALFGYLAWLANDVFKLTLAFPVLLAALGVAIIIVTVWLQRRFPQIVRRLGVTCRSRRISRAAWRRCWRRRCSECC